MPRWRSSLNGVRGSFRRVSYRRAPGYAQSRRSLRFPLHPHHIPRSRTYPHYVRNPLLPLSSVLTLRNRFSGSRTRQTGFDIDGDEIHYPTRPVDKDKAEAELVVNIKKATNPEETAPKQKHVRSTW